MSSEEYQPVVGPGTEFPIGMTLKQVSRLYRHVKRLKADCSINCKGEAGWVSWPDDVDGEWPASGIDATFTEVVQSRAAVDEDGLICGDGSLAPQDAEITGGPTVSAAGGSPIAVLTVLGASAASAFEADWGAILGGSWDGGDPPAGEEDLGVYSWPTSWSNYTDADVGIELFGSGVIEGYGHIFRLGDVYYPRLVITVRGDVWTRLSPELYEPDGYFNSEEVFSPSGTGYTTTWSHHSKQFGSIRFGAQSTKITSASTFNVTFLGFTVAMFKDQTWDEETEGITGGSLSMRDGRLEIGGLDTLVISVDEYFAYDPEDGGGPIVDSTTGDILRQL